MMQAGTTPPPPPPHCQQCLEHTSASVHSSYGIFPRVHISYSRQPYPHTSLAVVYSPWWRVSGAIHLTWVPPAGALVRWPLWVARRLDIPNSPTCWRKRVSYFVCLCVLCVCVCMCVCVCVRVCVCVCVCVVCARKLVYSDGSVDFILLYRCGTNKGYG